MVSNTVAAFPLYKGAMQETVPEAWNGQSLKLRGDKILISTDDDYFQLWEK